MVVFHPAFFAAVTHLQFAHRDGELAREFVIHAILHVQAVGAHAGLPRIAEFRGDRALELNDMGEVLGAVAEVHHAAAPVVERARDTCQLAKFPLFVS